MGHKIHPTGLRLGITQEHRSRWYAPSKTYPNLLQEDDKIRGFIQKKYVSAGISDVLIARKADQLEVELKLNLEFQLDFQLELKLEAELELELELGTFNSKPKPCSNSNSKPNSRPCSESKTS